MTSRFFAAALLVALLVGSPALRAESPMITDDAGTLERGGKKLEFDLLKLGSVYTSQLSFGFSPVDALELGLGIQGENDRGLGQRSRLAGLSAKWVPWRDGAWSGGVKAELNQVRVAGTSSSVSALTGLLTWRQDSGLALHGNLGRTWQTGPEESRWGLGLELPVNASVQATLEAVGSRSAGVNTSGTQAGLRWELQKGFKVFASFGRINAQRAASLGSSYEF